MTALSTINSEMNRKSLLSSFLADITHMPTYFPLFFSESFPHSQPSADVAVQKARGKRAEAGPIADLWDMEDYLAAITAHLKPLKRLGVDMVDAAIHTFSALWPGVESPKSIKDLAEYLKTSDERIHEWRESAARVGADEALAFVLSWYE